MEFAIIGAVIELAAFGLLFGIGLGIAAKKFAVQVDPRVEMILGILPNANCGGCGYPGCSGFAKAVAGGEAKVTACSPGGCAVAEKIAQILGVAAETAEPLVAVVRCNGGIRAHEKFVYDGIANCRAIQLIGMGHKVCSYGCLGFGTCVDECPFGALRMGDDGLPVTDFAKCTGCGICVNICPTKVLALVPASKSVFVACNSLDKGAFVRKACESGCIACMMCQKMCPQNAITIADNLARIDFAKCNECGVCIAVCPTKTILNKFADVLKANADKPAAVPSNPENTEKLVAEIKEKQKQQQAAKAATKKNERSAVEQPEA